MGILHGSQGKLEEADLLYLNENWQDYEVTVHALKSNVRMIGAESSYKLSKNLEEAAENGNIGYIKSHHEKLLMMVRNVVGIIRSSGKRIERSVYGEETYEKNTGCG